MGTDASSAQYTVARSAPHRRADVAAKYGAPAYLYEGERRGRDGFEFTYVPILCSRLRPLLHIFFVVHGPSRGRRTRTRP